MPAAANKINDAKKAAGQGDSKKNAANSGPEARLEGLITRGPAANVRDTTRGRARRGKGRARKPQKKIIDPTDYLDFVRRIASRMARNLPSHVSLDDLIGAGILGLIDAKERYDPVKAERFETFAEFRVKGAILDELRRYDIMARNARLTSKKIARKSHELTALYGRPPTESELARAMEMNVTDYRNLVNRVGSVRVFSLDDVSSDGEGNERSFELPANGMAPDEVTSVRELREHLRDAINGLPDRQQRIIEMYYDRGMTLKQIGMQVGVTESRVCQIMGEATNKLRVMMRSEVRRG